MPENKNDESGSKFTDMAGRLEATFEKSSDGVMANGLLNEVSVKRTSIKTRCRSMIGSIWC